MASVITDYALAALSASAAGQGQPAPSPIPQAEELALITKAGLLSQVHETIIDSWEKFGDEVEEIAQENRLTNETHQRNQSAEEAAGLVAQTRQNAVEAGMFWFYLGQHTDAGTRHLNTPI